MRQALGPGALGRPRGIEWRGRWEEGIRMGNTCKPMADSFQCMTKSTHTHKKDMHLISVNFHKNIYEGGATYMLLIGPLRHSDTK